jgi:hypothetical protein
VRVVAHRLDPEDVADAAAEKGASHQIWAGCPMATMAAAR